MSIRAGIVGLGGVAKEHIKNYRHIPNVDIVAVCDINRTLADDVARDCGANPYDHYETMMDEERLTCVSICTPPSPHRAITEAAAKRGIHVFCEKPMASSTEECRAMIEACAGADVRLMIGHKKRYSPYYRFIKEKCDETGSPPLWASVRYALGRVDKDWFWDPQNGGGPLRENSVHIFDILRYLMGDVQSVFASGGTFFMDGNIYAGKMNAKASVPDVATAVLKFQSGGVASLGIGYGSEWPVAREELALATPHLTFELGGRFDRADTLRYVYRDNPSDILFFEREGDEPFDGGFAGEFQDFVGCIESGGDPVANGEAGLEAVRLAEAVKESIRTGTQVELRNFQATRNRKERA